MKKNNLSNMKNPFITSIRQRNFILIWLLVALFSTFLPAVNIVFAGSFSIAGYENYGIATIALLIFAMIIIFFDEEILSLLRKKTQTDFPANTITFVVTAICVAIMAGVFYAWTEIVFNSDIREIESLIQVNGKKNLITTGIGLYFTFLSLAFVLWSIFGFNNLQKTCEIIVDKTKNLKKPEENSENNATKTEKSEEKTDEKSEEKTENHDNQKSQQ